MGNRTSTWGTSKYKGVTWLPRIKKWRATITVNGKQMHLGVFSDEIEAAKVRDKAAKQYHGTFAHLNF